MLSQEIEKQSLVLKPSELPVLTITETKELTWKYFEYLRLRMARTQLQIEASDGEWNNEFWHEIAKARDLFDSSFETLQRARNMQKKNKKGCELTHET